MGTGDNDSDAAESYDGATGSFLLRVAHGAEPSEAEAAEDGPTWAPPRFERMRRLGEGGFGVVYEAYDAERRAHVALKTSARRGARDLVRFKREFRSLADLAHRNLVQLYELHGDEARWFFTMELIRGQDLRAYLRARG